MFLNQNQKKNTINEFLNNNQILNNISVFDQEESLKVVNTENDGFNNTLTIIKAESTEYIFWGFTSECWDSSGKHKADNSAFLFSLTSENS